MSATGNAMKTAAETAADNQTAGADLMARYEKKDKVVVLANDDQEAFVDFAGLIGEANYVDWTEGTDNSIFTGLAMVRTEGQANRLIPIASEEAAFADAAVRKALYRIYVNRVVNTASDNEATAAQFITVGGSFKQKFDLDAFKFQAKALCKFLRGQKLSGVTTTSLRLAFASAAFAKTQFPRVPDTAWTKIIGIAKQTADARGYDLSIFDHWEATRAVPSADTSALELDFSELLKAEEEEVGDEHEEAETAAQ